MNLLANDPLLAGHIDWGVVLIVIVKAAITLGITLLATMLMIWFERKIISDLQNRIGPNRAGPWGLLQTLADGIKLIFKEDLRPDVADPLVFRLAPYLSVVPAFLTFTIVPIGGIFTNGGDGTIGPRANLGAGTIFCNYDGFDKFETHVGADAFIGSDTALVAPVTVGDGAFTGSGSVITEDVPPNALALGRGRQVIKEGWAAAFRAEKQANRKPK